MGARAGSTKPFEREELERLAAATSNKAAYRPTSKMTKEELLGLVSRSARPPSQNGAAHADVTVQSGPAAPAESTTDALPQLPLVEVVPQPSPAFTAAEPIAALGTVEVAARGTVEVAPLGAIEVAPLGAIEGAAPTAATSDNAKVSEPRPRQALQPLSRTESSTEPPPAPSQDASVGTVAVARPRLSLYISVVLVLVCCAVIATRLLVL